MANSAVGRDGASVAVGRRGPARDHQAVERYLQQAGFTVTDIDGLTGLAEYRNGGLFVDTGVLALRDPSEAAQAHDVGSALVVEWRALTVALLDRLALAVRAKLDKNAAALPLAKILEGGSWAAGRALAFARRPDGSPPIKISSDGTVF